MCVLAIPTDGDITLALVVHSIAEALGELFTMVAQDFDEEAVNRGDNQELLLQGMWPSKTVR